MAVEASQLPAPLSRFGVQYNREMFYFVQKHPNGTRWLHEPDRRTFRSGGSGRMKGRALLQLGNSTLHKLVFVRSPGVLHAQEPKKRVRRGPRATTTRRRR